MPGLGIEKKIDESNKGHQLLLRMGWSGSSGLGANEQGLFLISIFKKTLI
jgi:hypothetical protein